MSGRSGALAHLIAEEGNQAHLHIEIGSVQFQIMVGIAEQLADDIIETLSMCNLWKAAGETLPLTYVHRRILVKFVSPPFELLLLR